MTKSISEEVMVAQSERLKKLADDCEACCDFEQAEQTLRSIIDNLDYIAREMREIIDNTQPEHFK